MHQLGHFMTVLKELLFSLVYFSSVNKLILERKQVVMKHFLKGVAAVAIVMSISMLMHIFLNMKGIDLNRYIDDVVEILLTSSLAILTYQALIKNEKNKDDQE